MDVNYYKKFEPIFGSWYIKKMLGEGGFGQVYEIERTELGATYKAALKTITIPKNQSEIRSIKAEGMSDDDVTEYYKGVVTDIISEFQLMAQLKGNSHIVSYEDHQLIKHEDGIGWDILIRMELLTPLLEHAEKNQISRREIIRMGIELCKSLELCQKYNIIHRDVKPENIFISALGDYKLGDFGIARTAEKTVSAMSRTGTSPYMAPEVYLGKPYGSTVDIYSLGLVMYKMLNDNRAPFLPAYPAPVTYNDRNESLVKRMSGIALPPPSNATGRLAEIILKACEYEPEKRYHSAAQMRADLEAILYSEKEADLIYPEGDAIVLNPGEDDEKTLPPDVIGGGEVTTILPAVDDAGEVTEVLPSVDDDGEVTTILPAVDDGGDVTVILPVDPVETVSAEVQDQPDEEEPPVIPERPPVAEKKEEKSKKGLIIGIAAAVVIVAIIIALVIPKGVDDIKGIDGVAEILIGDKLSPEYVIEPEKYSEEPITFTIADEKIASVNENGAITAKAVGETVLTMQVEDYKEEATVTVKAKVTAIKNVAETIKIVEGETETVKPQLVPSKYADLPVTYKITDTKIASVDKQGTITAKKPGKTKLQISAGGFKRVVNVKVEEYVPETTVYYPTYNYHNSNSSDSGSSSGGGTWE